MDYEAKGGIGSGSAYAKDSVGPTKESEVSREMNILENQSESLLKLIDILENRLGSVLSPESELAADAQSETERAISTPLASKLSAQNYRLGAVVGRVKSITRRLEV